MQAPALSACRQPFSIEPGVGGFQLFQGYRKPNHATCAHPAYGKAAAQFRDIIEFQSIISQTVKLISRVIDARQQDPSYHQPPLDLRGKSSNASTGLQGFSRIR